MEANPLVERGRAVRRVLLVTLGANLLAAGAKLLVGWLSGSLAMVADGIHSLLDSTSNLVGLVGSTIASRPPDRTHPYGHRRFETLASLVIGGVLLLTAWELLQSAFASLSDPQPPEIGPLNFAVLLGTMALNFFISRYERRKGRELSSELLHADSEHTASDFYASLVVLISFVGVLIGFPWVDAAATFLVVGLIAWASFGIISNAVNILVDRAMLDAEKVSQIAGRVPGVERVAHVRSRGPADDVHLQLSVSVAGATTAEQSAAITGEISNRLKGAFEGLQNVYVEVLPDQNYPPDLSQLARAEADALGLKVHEVTSAYGADGLRLQMHVEVPPGRSVEEAHRVVSDLEARLLERVRGVTRILTHIEPAATGTKLLDHSPEAAALAQQATQIAAQLYPQGGWHEVEIYKEQDGGSALTMHCHLDGAMPLAEAHHLVEEVEARIRSSLPALHEVTIHTEPFK